MWDITTSNTSDLRDVHLSSSPWSAKGIGRRALRGLAWGVAGAAAGTGILLLTADFQTGYTVTRGGLVPLSVLWVVWVLLPLAGAWAYVLEPLTVSRAHGALAGILAVLPLVGVILLPGSNVPAWQRGLTLVLVLGGGALFGSRWRDRTEDRVDRGDA